MVSFIAVLLISSYGKVYRAYNIVFIIKTNLVYLEHK